MVSHTFTGHHWPGLKAIIACTLKATDDISACAVAAGIADVTLVSVCIEESYINPIKHLGVRVTYTSGLITENDLTNPILSQRYKKI